MFSWSLPSGRGRVWLALCVLVPVLGVALGVHAQQTQERRHLRHILLRSEADADMIIAKLDAGDDFKKLCRKYSLDPPTKLVGGDLGEHGPIWEPDFNRVAFGIAEKGGYGKAKSQYGWHVIQVLGIKKVDRPVSPTLPKPPTPADPETRRTPTGGVVNNDLSVEVRAMKTAFLPGEDVELVAIVSNNTDGPITAFNPKLWPLGLIVRYQFGRHNITLTPSWDGEPEGGYTMELAARESREVKFRLQDYTGKLTDWGLIRCIWRGDVLFQRLSKHFEDLTQNTEYEEWRRRWRYYASEESRINVLPEYKAGERWFAMVYLRSFIWVELKDPGIPGLMEHFIAQVREGHHRQIPLKQHLAGQYLLSGMPPELPQNPMPTFPVPRDSRIEPHRPMNLSLMLQKSRDGAREVTPRIAIALDNPQGLDVSAIPIGDVFKGRQYIDWAADRFDTALENKRPTPQVSVITLYTYDILPPEVKTLVDLPLAERQAQDIAPAATRRPSAFASDLPQVRIDTARGSLTIELLEDHAPNTVANFIELTEQKFFDGLLFFRDERNEGNPGYIQGGSPNNTRLGDPGYRIKDEKSAQLKHERGVVAMAGQYRKPDTGGSQFYICRTDQPQLDGEFTIFGRVVRGIEVLDKLEEGDAMTRVVVVRKRDHEYKAEKTTD